MSLIPRNSLFDFDNILDHFFAPSVSSSKDNKTFFSPRIDIKENDGHYEVTAELPGVKKEDIHITLDNGVLSIEAESKQEEKEEKKGKVIRQERRYGKFMRSFTVGNAVKEADINASFENGILTLKAPKVPEDTPSVKRIDIS